MTALTRHLGTIALAVLMVVVGGPPPAAHGEAATPPTRGVVGGYATRTVVTGAGREGLNTIFSFDDVAEGALPRGWKIEATNPSGRLAEWAVAKDTNAPSKPKVLSLSKINDPSGGVFNLCWNPTATFKDGDIEVTARANSGEEDQGGGPIWRARDANNYYVARYNPLEGNFRLYYVKEGRRRLLADAGGLKVKASEWFTIKITHHGDRIEGWLNGHRLLVTTDRTFREAGGLGVWTKADAATSFDAYSVTRARTE